MKQYLFITIVFSFFLTSPAYAWRCGQKCPSSIFSGKLECQAHNAACKVSIPKPTFNKPTESGFGHVPVSPDYEQRRKEKERYEKQRVAEKRRYEQALRDQKKSVQMKKIQRVQSNFVGKWITGNNVPWNFSPHGFSSTQLYGRHMKNNHQIYCTLRIINNDMVLCQGKQITDSKEVASVILKSNLSVNSINGTATVFSTGEKVRFNMVRRRN